MPKRPCACPGCTSCQVTSGTHGVVFDASATRSLKCPGCQQVASQRAEQQRAQRRGTAAQRGYGTVHRKTREDLLRQWQPGDPCAHCGGPMWSQEGLDLAHTADRGGYRGLAHAACNRGNR